MTKKPFVSPSFLKQQARQLKKEKSLSQAEALNEASKQLGFSNYKNYLNLLKAGRRRVAADKKALLQSISSEKQAIVSARLDIVLSRVQSLKVQLPAYLDSLVKSLPPEEGAEGFQNNQPELKEYIELHLFKDALEDGGGEIDSFAPYHIPKMVSLKNVTFNMEEGMLQVEGDYDLKLEFGFEYDRAERDDFFDDREMFGSFELSIDSDGRLFVEHQDIGHSW